MKILQLPNQTLREKTKSINTYTPKLERILKEMIKTLKEQKNPPGVGLAAPQIGYPLKIFLIKPPKEKIELFINPKILSKKGEYEEKDKTLEGCLSLHGYYGSVKRASEIVVSYQTIDLENPNSTNSLASTLTKTFTDFPAVIIQHEMDHLEGILFIDRIIEQKGKLYKIEKDEKNKEILEEVKL